MVRFVRERRALAALAFAFFATLYTILGLVVPPEVGRLLLAFGALYLFAFLGVAAEWFFGRWVAMGLAVSGSLTAIAALLQIGVHPVLLVYGGLHGLAWACLHGKGMSRSFEGQAAWRQRFAMDDEAAARLGKAVTRGAAALPYLVSMVLAPREPGQALSLLALVLLAGGLTSLVRNRALGIPVLGASLVAGIAATTFVRGMASVPLFGAEAAGRVIALPSASLLGGATLLTLLAVLPLAGPALRFLAGRSDERPEAPR